MWLIVGLGNPGAEYAATRHNIGFMGVDLLAGNRSFSSKYQGEFTSIELDGEKLHLLKPMTYMNLSGKSVQAAMAFYKFPANLIVLHDELDLPLGKIRIKKGGGANGHNGLRDIDRLIGAEYWRIRLGIGHPGDKNRVHDYVLNRFTTDEQPLLEKTLAAVVSSFPFFWNHTPEKMATKVAETLNPPRQKPKTEAPAPAKDSANNA